MLHGAELIPKKLLKLLEPEASTDPNFFTNGDIGKKLLYKMQTL